MAISTARRGDASVSGSPGVGSAASAASAGGTGSAGTSSAAGAGTSDGASKLEQLAAVTATLNKLPGRMSDTAWSLRKMGLVGTNLTLRRLAKADIATLVSCKALEHEDSYEVTRAAAKAGILIFPSEASALRKHLALRDAAHEQVRAHGYRKLQHGLQIPAPANTAAVMLPKDQVPPPAKKGTFALPGALAAPRQGSVRHALPSVEPGDALGDDVSDGESGVDPGANGKKKKKKKKKNGGGGPMPRCTHVDPETGQQCKDDCRSRKSKSMTCFRHYQAGRRAKLAAAKEAANANVGAAANAAAANAAAANAAAAPPVAANVAAAPPVAAPPVVAAVAVAPVAAKAKAAKQKRKAKGKGKGKGKSGDEASKPPPFSGNNLDGGANFFGGGGGERGGKRYRKRRRTRRG